MSKSVLTNLNLSQNQLLNAVVQNLAAAPSSPVAGQVYYDTTLNALRNWNATSAAWELQATNSLLLQSQNGAYYLARANQTGTQLASTVSNLQATVIGYTLDTFAVPIANVNINGQRLLNVGTPITGTDGVNKNYVDSTVQGLTPKPTARAATTAALPANTYSNGAAGVGATLTANANGVLTVDTYAVALNDLVLVKNEATSANNGLYNLTTVGTGSVPYVLTRNVDMDQSTEFGGGLMTVENVGSANSNSLWVCNVANSITVGTTAVSFTQLNSATVLTQGNGISISGNTVTAVAAASGGIVVGAGGISIDTTIGVRKYAQLLTTSATSYAIVHGLATQDVIVNVYAAATPFAEVECDVTHDSTTQVSLGFATAPAANAYRVVVHG